MSMNHKFLACLVKCSLSYHKITCLHFLASVTPPAIWHRSQISIAFSGDSPEIRWRSQRAFKSARSYLSAARKRSRAWVVGSAISPRYMKRRSSFTLWNLQDKYYFCSMQDFLALILQILLLPGWRHILNFKDTLCSFFHRGGEHCCEIGAAAWSTMGVVNN